MTTILCAKSRHGFFDEAVAVAVVTVGCKHEHVTVGVGACVECLGGLLTGTMECGPCGDAGEGGCKLLVQEVREFEPVPA